MKQIIYLLEEVSLLIALLCLFACSNDNEMNSSGQETNTNHLYKIVVNATKSNGESTRGLSLDGTTLNQKWNEGESVTVIKKDGINWTEIGTLMASASTEANTTLSGTVSANLSLNDELYLLFPRTTWDYTGQNGILYDTNSETTIEKKYDYAQAIVYVTAIEGNNVTLKRKDGVGNYYDGAVFEKEQAITKFTFSVPVKTFTIKSTYGGLVQYYTLDPSGGLGFYATNGDLTITASTDQTVFYVAIRNNSDNKDYYSFSATDASNNHYAGIKSAKLVNGNYYAADVTLFPVEIHNNHEYVDLGLPSGTKWATMNVEANSIVGSGGYYAWGETAVKTTYNWTTYIYGNSSSCTNLGDISGSPSYDVARVMWGGSWQIPTLDDYEELKNNCTWTWTTICGVKGSKVTASNGNSIFLPAEGGYFDFNSNNLEDVGTYGYYWTSSEFAHDSGFTLAYNYSCSDHAPSDGMNRKDCGFMIRPVIK